MSREPAGEYVPVVKTNAMDVEKFLLRLRERLRESRVATKLKEDEVALMTELEDILTDAVSATTSDIIVPPSVADQYVLTDAMTMVSCIEKSVLKPILDEFNQHVSHGRIDDALRSLATYLYMKRIGLDAVVQVLKRRLTHIYINMPPTLRPSLASASIGYEKIE